MNQPTAPSSETADAIDTGAARFKAATSNAVAGAKDAVDRAADHVEAGLHAATDKVAAGAHCAGATLDEAGERGRAAIEAGRAQADAWLDELRGYVREKPVQSVAIAVGAGWLLARLLRR